MSSDSLVNVLWTPHPKQIEALERSEFEVLYGGARGGGKTAAGIAWLVEYTEHPFYRGLVLRRNAEDLKDWIDRANQLYSQLGAVQKGSPPEFHWPSGAVIRTGHLKDSDAYTKYQGHEYHKILIEELTHIPEEKHYIRILSSARSTTRELSPQVFLTTNPGGKGHMWVKKRFVDPAVPGTTIWPEKGRTRCYIPATIDDNPTLMNNSPEYVEQIEALKDTDNETYMAWRFGDWDRFAGQVFKEVSQAHKIKTLVPDSSFTHYLCMDWGYSENSAFAAYLYIVKNEKLSDGQKFNRVVTYKEFYGNMKSPDEWAEIIFRWCKKAGVHPKVGDTDPAMHNTQTDGSIDIAKLFMRKWKELNRDENWCTLRRGNNNRVARVASFHNWLSMAPDGLPYWVWTEQCINLSRTLPMLVYSEHNVEDVDTDQEDHPYDANGYGITKVKFVAVKPGSYSAIQSEKKRHLSIDSSGMPVINPKAFFGTIS